MTKTKCLFALVALLAIVSVVALAQSLPAGDARNDEFLRHFEAVKKANPKIKDFTHMLENTSYALPGGQTDNLQVGDVRGIWGREYGKFYNNPVTSGPAIVPGGIQPNETQRLNDHFDREAISRHATRIGAVESGTITGEGTVGYANGETRPYRITTPLRAYRARFRMQDGTEQTFITLQGCMNPVNYGGEVYQGFTFTPDQNQVGQTNNNDDPPPPAAGWFSTHKKYWVPGLLLLVAALTTTGLLVARQRRLRPVAEVKANKVEQSSGVHPWVSPTGKPIATKQPPPLATKEVPLAFTPVAVAEVPVAEPELPKGANTNPLVVPEGVNVLDVASAEPLPHLQLLDVPVTKETTPVRTHISYAPAEDGKPEMLRYNGVNLHSVDFEEDGTTVIRFSRK